MAKTHREMLRELLQSGELNQKELAERIGVSPAQITRWLKNSEPKLAHFRKIEELYNKIAV